MSHRDLRVVVVIVALAALPARGLHASNILEFVGANYNGSGGITGMDHPETVAVSPDGKHVYVASSYASSVTVFRRDAADGALTFVEAKLDNAGGIDGLGGAIAVKVSPDGKNVYVASQYDSGAVAVFARNVTTGALTFVEAEFNGRGGVTGMAGARAVAVSPDGAHVYIVGRSDNGLAVFARDAATGALTFVEAVIDGVGTVNGLEWAQAVAVSPDGRHVYATGSFDDMVASFTRDAGTGKLTFVETDAVTGAEMVTVSPDGSHVYVAGSFDIYVFSRDVATGALTEVEEKDTTQITGADFPNGLAVSPNGEYLYVASSFDDGFAIFQRSPTTGQLTFVESHVDGAGGIEGLQGCSSVAVSPDNANVYATGADDDAVAVFWKDFPVEFVEGNEAYFAQDWAAAEQHYTNVLAQDPTSAVAYNNRGLARCKQLKFSSAQSDFSSAKSHDPAYVAPYVNLGKCLAMQSDFAGARAQFEAGLLIDPDHVKLLYNLGWIEAEQGNYDAALAKYQAALAKDASYVRAIVASGVAQAEKDQVDASVATFYQAINKAPTGDIFAAIAAYDLQLLRGPGVRFTNDAAARDYQDGLFDMRVGLFAQAADHFASARNLEPDVADIPWMLAWSKLRQLDSSAAAAAWADARALMPELQVDSTSPSQVYVDGMFRGNTPKTLKVFASRFDLTFRRSEGPKERIIVAYADGTPGGASPITVALKSVSSFSLFGAEADADRDWLGDAWEQASFGSLQHTPQGDCDRDRTDNLHEYWALTDPGSTCPSGPRVRRHLRTAGP